MTEYIEREAAVKAILDKEDREIKNDYEFCLGLIVASNAVSDVPAADVAPVRHGRWIDKPSKRGYGLSTYCSHCGQHSGIGGIESNRHRAYCPNCGALMDKALC